MKPKPFSSLNHLTVPVAIVPPGEVTCGETREMRWQQLRNAEHSLVGQIVRQDGTSVAVAAIDHRGARPYSSSLTCRPHVTGLPDSSFCCIAMWTMNRLGAAPCQWFSPGSKNTRSPGR